MILKINPAWLRWLTIFRNCLFYFIYIPVRIFLIYIQYKRTHLLPLYVCLPKLSVNNVFVLFWIMKTKSDNWKSDCVLRDPPHITIFLDTSSLLSNIKQKDKSIAIAQSYSKLQLISSKHLPYDCLQDLVLLPLLNSLILRYQIFSQKFW